MCTVIAMKGNRCYFGRNLDLSYHYNETVTITPRKYFMRFTNGHNNGAHYAMIGIATVVDNYPLYYDAMNEKGLYIAALNFPGNAIYRKPDPEMTNIASYEVIPWFLANCASVTEAKNALKTMNITDKQFSEQLTPTPLHWLIGDRDETIVLESVSEGIFVYNNPIGVLTNNPPFPFQKCNLQNYMNLSPYSPVNHFSKLLDLRPDSLGMGALGLPGDLSSSSRFVRAAFHLHNATHTKSKDYNIGQVFRILNAVSQTEGCVDDNGKPTKTVYSSCCDVVDGVYYYTTYENAQITGVSMHKAELSGMDLISYPLRTTQNYYLEN